MSISPRALHFDVVVIGAGTAGLTAGARLAQAGAKVCVLAKGVGSTHLASGTIDVLGYAPDPVAEPLAALAGLPASHPYARIGAGAVSEALQWFATTAQAGPHPGYGYSGSAETNLRLPTAVGALRPSALVPDTMAAGDAAGLSGVCIVGTPALRDFHPALCAQNLTAAGIEARSVSMPLVLERADMSALGIARRLDDPDWRAQFCAQLSPMLRAEEYVGLPAMLGIADPHGVVADLQTRLGRRVFEIPTLPPSVPGMRLYEILRSALRASGGRLVLGGEVISAQRDGDRIASVATRSAGRDKAYAAPWFVLASGGFASGGIELDSRWTTRERILGLALDGVPAAGQPRFTARYLDEQPLARAGVAVDDDLRAIEAPNVFVAGAALPGAAAWREGCGEGVALGSAVRVAQMIAAELGARVAA